MLFLYEEEVRTHRVTPGYVCRDPVRTRRHEGGHLRGNERTSLVVPCLRICLPVQGIQVGSLVWEDPTCHRSPKPVSHNYWSCAPRAPTLRREKPLQWAALTPQLQNSHAQQQSSAWDPLSLEASCTQTPISAENATKVIFTICPALLGSHHGHVLEEESLFPSRWSVLFFPPTKPGSCRNLWQAATFSFLRSQESGSPVF